jgi:hypothetical protein
LRIRVVSLWSVGDGSERPERNEVESKDTRGGFFDCISLRSIPPRRPPPACCVQALSLGYARDRLGVTKIESTETS